VKKLVKGFSEFNRINEDEGAERIKLRGYGAEKIIGRIGDLMKVLPDRVKFGVPADIKGYSITYRDANGAIEKINDLNKQYSSRGEEVTFYCWNIGYAGSWDATQSLREKIKEAGGFGSSSNMNLKKVIDYFTKNQEDVDNVRSIALSIDSKSIRKSAIDMDQEEVYPTKAPQPDSTEEETSDEKVTPEQGEEGEE
jgi:hypothetical protein